MSIDARTTRHTSACYDYTTSPLEVDIGKIKQDPLYGSTAASSQAGTISGKTTIKFTLFKMTEISFDADISSQHSTRRIYAAYEKQTEI